MKTVKLKDISINNRGYYGIGASAVDYDVNKYTYLRITDINDDGSLNKNGLMSVDDEKANQYLLEKNDMVFARTGASTGRNYFYDGEIENMVYAGFLIKFSLDPNLVNPKYVKYYCLSQKYNDWILSSLTGSTRPNINEKQLADMPIELPERNYQDKVVEIMDSLTNKIKLNNEINNNLYDIGINIYNEKIVKNGYDRELKTFFEVLTGKKDANASSENGLYPFFTCSKQISRIDDYSFNASAILLAGNGDFNVKVYKGKFDAYQRTYVLIPNNELYLGYLYFAISENLWDLTSGFRGSVIKFITKGMIENYKIPFINDDYIFEYLNNIVEKIKQNNDENIQLSQLRDTLLPTLMNGKIDLDNIEI